MSELFLYTLKSAFVLAILYVPYTLLLRQEDFFRFNRLTLLGILLLVLVLPFGNVSFLSLDNQPVVHVARQQLIEIGIPIMQAVDETDAAAGCREGISWFQAVSFVSLLGMVAMLCLRLIQLARMGMTMRGGCLWYGREDGVNIYCHADAVLPYSWFGNVVISKEDYDAYGYEIILHEKGHVRSLHSLDILLLTFVEVLQWWNPLVYMLGISLRDVHEYEADAYVLRQGIPLRYYQNLLIKKAVGASSYTFANNFNHSLIKKRITMMCKKKSNPWMRSKVLYAVPMVAIALSAFATPTFVGTVEQPAKRVDSAPLSGDKITNKSSFSQAVGEVFDKKPQFEGGELELMKLLQANVRYPAIAQEYNVQGRVVVQFIVGQDGSITDLKADTKDLGYAQGKTKGKALSKTQNAKPISSTDSNFQAARKALEDEALRVVRLTSSKWKPGEQHGKKVRMKYSLPITFRLK